MMIWLWLVIGSLINSLIDVGCNQLHFLVINNASAISLTKTSDTDMKRYDLMHQINGRGTFLV
jgi:hypothetical protein